MSHECKLQVEIKIMTAIGLCGSEGASLDDIQQHLKSTLKNNVPDLESIQSVINDAVAKGFLLELDNGKYKVKGSAERPEATSKGTSVARVAKEIVKAITLCGSEGASLDDIQQHLTSTLKNNVPDLEFIQWVLNNDNFKELLLELDNGKYKIKGSSKPAEETSKGTNMSDKVLSNLHREDNEIKATTRAKENDKEVECFDGKVAQDANRNTDSDTKSIGTSIAEKDTNVSLPDDNDRVLPKLNKLHLKDNETKATGKCAEENAQEVKRPLDKGTQDADRNADSDKGRVFFSETEKDANIPLPDDDDKIDKEKLIKCLKKEK